MPTRTSKSAEAQVAQDLDALERVDVGCAGSARARQLSVR
jgi:hypothetical protein